MNKAVGIGNLVSEGLRAGRNGIAAVPVQMEDGSARSSRSIFRIEIMICLLRDGAGAAEQYRIEHGNRIRLNECPQFAGGESTCYCRCPIFRGRDISSKELLLEIGAVPFNYFVGSGFPNAYTSRDLDC